MSLDSREKGKRGEREAAAKLSMVLGVDCHRGQQFRGGPDSPDVIGVPGLHVEVKRREKFRLYDSLSQACQEAGNDNVPVVMHRRNNEDWVVILYLDDLHDFIEAIQKVRNDVSEPIS